MSEKAASKRTSKPISVEVPGTPDQVWRAIATGPGISSWLFPAEVEERQGGSLAFHLAPGMDSRGTVTVWDPPKTFAYEEPNWMENAPPLGTEFVVEARAGGTCVVRLVHSLFADSDRWDKEFDGFEKGWRGFFKVLRLYLARFTDQRAETVRVQQAVDASEAEAWKKLRRALTLDGLVQGDRWATAGSGAPPVTGIVEYVGGAHEPEAMALLSEPAPGIALMGVGSFGNQVFAMLSFYFFSPDPNVAREAESAWQHWAEALSTTEP